MSLYLTERKLLLKRPLTPALECSWSPKALALCWAPLQCRDRGRERQVCQDSSAPGAAWPRTQTGVWFAQTPATVLDPRKPLPALRRASLSLAAELLSLPTPTSTTLPSGGRLCWTTRTSLPCRLWESTPRAAPKTRTGKRLSTVSTAIGSTALTPLTTTSTLRTWSRPSALTSWSRPAGGIAPHRPSSTSTSVGPVWSLTDWTTSRWRPRRRTPATLRPQRRPLRRYPRRPRAGQSCTRSLTWSARLPCPACRKHCPVTMVPPGKHAITVLICPCEHSSNFTSSFQRQVDLVLGLQRGGNFPKIHGRFQKEIL